MPSVRLCMTHHALIELHVWGDPCVVARRVGPHTYFLSAVGPGDLERWRHQQVRQSLPATCLGFHLEGPYLNPTMAGALDWRACRPRVRVRELAALIEVGRGRVRMMTMAPELPGAIEGIRWLRRHGVVVSLGHTDATYAQARHAIDAGATSATHLFNRMRPWHHREPGVIGAVLDDKRVSMQLIADGVHVHPAAVRWAVRWAGPRRIILTTDNVAGAARAQRLRQRDGAYYTHRGTLAGSALTLPAAVRNIVRWTGVDVAQARAMATTQPARLLEQR